MAETHDGMWHYAEAERLLAQVRQVPFRAVQQPTGSTPVGSHEEDPENAYYEANEESTAQIAAAQVHATLALASATIDAAYTVHEPGDPIRGERPRVVLARDRLGEGYGR